jgi:hypothetical protein
MLESSLRNTWRRLIKNILPAFLNLVKLSIGLACIILIYLWVCKERSMDQFHANGSRLYQVMSHISLPDGIHTQEGTPGMLARALAEEMPEVEAAIAVQAGDGPGEVSAEENHMKATPQFVDPGFFTVFSYRLIQGNKDRPFRDKHSVLLSDELAGKLFHSTQNITGKTIQWGDENESYTVSGIFEKPGPHSSIQFDLLFDYALYFEKHKNDLQYWENSSPGTYLLLKKGADPIRLSTKIKSFLQTKSDRSPQRLSLIKYTDKYLHGTYENGQQTGGRILYVRLLSVIDFFFLVLACIHFINQAAATASRRSKEAGIKKVTGAGRKSLMLRYLGESLLMAFLSLIFAIAWVILLLPRFNLSS